MSCKMFQEGVELHRYLNKFKLCHISHSLSTTTQIMPFFHISTWINYAKSRSYDLTRSFIIILGVSTD